MRKKGVGKRKSGQVPPVMKEKINTDVWIPLVIVKEEAASRKAITGVEIN